MKLLKNLLLSVRHFKAAAILNILGLSVAFAAFTIIMSQVVYDLSFDRHYRHTDRIFRLENQLSCEEGEYIPFTARPVGTKTLQAIPEIEQWGLFNSNNPKVFVYDRDHGKLSMQGPYTDITADAGLLDVLEFEYLFGGGERFVDPNTVLVSESVARALYANENPVGRSLILGKDIEHPREIVGVFRNPPKNSTLEPVDIVRFIADESVNDPGSDWNYIFYVRLNSSQNASKVETDINARNRETLPEGFETSDHFFRLTPIANIHFASNVLFDPVAKGNPSTIYFLMTTALLIILIALINCVNFATSLVPVRIKGINTRKVLGESDRSIRWNLVAETLGLALVSLLVSLVLVKLFDCSSLSLLVDSDGPIGSNGAILTVTAVAAVITGLLAGIPTAFYSTSFPPALVLKGSFGLSSKGRRLRTILISFQYVISITIIVIALSTDAQRRFMQRYDVGYQRENILSMDITQSVADQRKAVENKLKSNPAITDATFAADAFVSDRISSRWARKCREQNIWFNVFAVEPDFLSFMKIGIEQGRDFAPNDALRTDLSAVIMNSTAHRRIGIEAGDILEGNIEVVGISNDFNNRSLKHDIDPLAFIVTGNTYPHFPLTRMFVKVKEADMASTIDFIRSTVREFDPDATADPEFIDRSIGKLYEQERHLSELIALASLLSILISMAGVFGLIMFETQYRRKEIGLRKVYGATIGEILWIFNSSYVRLVLACSVVAIPIGWYVVDRWLENFAYRMPVGWWIFAVALLAVLAVTVLTITLQSYRAATENPVRSIKTE